ncbi:hypothetical protein CCACVL1_11246 [Corchorus capsularis]|uniref:Hikeshi-like C-terminal domain-containing protein n=1 Tax=Corchorus capsularis TaxID=210143 RepID=A0A1R3IMA5_COCAP|nr:hypothetical protein CCACVL1_11246 [Corchorus capsularis]
MSLLLLLQLRKKKKPIKKNPQFLSQLSTQISPRSLSPSDSNAMRSPNKLTIFPKRSTLSFVYPSSTNYISTIYGCLVRRPPSAILSSLSVRVRRAVWVSFGKFQIGVSVEDLAALPSLDVAAEKKIERLALKVGENLFNFMLSFCGVDGSKLVVPMDILDRWFKQFQEKAKRDPEYLKGFAL